MIDPIANLLGEWSSHITVESIFLKLILAVILSAIIGCERSNKRHSAGLRTFIIVTFASTLAMMIDMFLIEVFGTTMVIISATTVIAIAILSSNSTLFTAKNQIKGLTTSIALWACAILGFCIGAGFYTVALIAFVIFFSCLSILPQFETYLKNRSNHFEIHLELQHKSNLHDFVITIRRLGLRIDDIESNPAYKNSGLSVYSISLTIISQELKKYKTHTEIIEAIKSLSYVSHIEEMN